MPLGEPMGGETPYIEGGKLERVWIVSIPVSDLERAIDFYSCSLGLEIVLDARGKNWVEFGPAEPLAKIAVYVPEKADRRQPGGDSGVVLSTDSIYELHRKLVDEGVKFRMKPEKRPFGGLMAVFEDPDGNLLTVVEDREHYSRGPPPVQPLRGSAEEPGRSCRVGER